MAKRIGGIVFIKADGVSLQAKGSWTFDPGVNKKEMVAGSDGVHGYTEVPKPARLEGVITDSADLDVEALYSLNDATLTIEFANGKLGVVEEAVYSGDGEATSEAGEIAVEFQGTRGRYVTA